jgi:hypothetical protein
MTLKIYVSPTGRLIREDIGKPAEVALADVFRHTLSTQERTDALAGVYGDEVRIRVLEIEADTPAGNGGAVASVAGKTGVVTLVKADVGLGNVDNTSDAAKPISTAQAAVNAAVAATVATKADKLTTVSVSVAGNYDLTEAAHNGRRVIAAVPGVVFTRTTAWTAAAVGCFLDVDSDGTFTLGTGITVPAGCASGSATSAAGSVDLACVDGVLKSATTASVVVVQNVTVYKLPPVSDISPASTNEVLIFEQVIPNLVALSEVEASIRAGSVGAGAKNFRMLVGGDAGVANGTQVAIATTTGSGVTQRQNIGFIVNGDATGVIGQSPNIVSFGTTSTLNPAVTIPAAGLRVKIAAGKGSAGDTLNFQGGQVRVFA